MPATALSDPATVSAEVDWGTACYDGTGECGEGAGFVTAGRRNTLVTGLRACRVGWSAAAALAELPGAASGSCRLALRGVAAAFLAAQRSIGVTTEPE